jgi:CubicO group peptidase (beta-lactamase class C family)
MSTPNRPSSPFSSKFDDLVQGLLQAWHVPGLAIAVIDGASTFSKVSGSVSLMIVFADIKTRVMDMLFFLIKR